MIFKAKIKGELGYIYILVEHQSKPDKMMPLRLLSYTCKLMSRHVKQSKDRRLPIVYPMVLYHGNKKYPYSMDIFALFPDDQRDLAKSILMQPFQLIDLGTIDDDEFYEYQWAGIMELVLKYVGSKGVMSILKPLLLLLRSIEDKGGDSYLVTTLQYIIQTSDIPDKKHFFEIVTSGLKAKTGETIMTIADQLREEGMQQGMQQGMRQGVQEGWHHGVRVEKRDVVLRLKRKNVDAEIIAIATGLNMDEINQLIAHEEGINS